MNVFAMTVFSPTRLVIAALVLAVGLIAIAYRRAVRKCRVLDIALNNISQGLVLFDRTERMVNCNDRYIDLYGLSRAVVKPGATLCDIIRNRCETGSLAIDIEKYRAEIVELVSAGDVSRRIVETPDG
jgi:PAS domain-containing protein